MYDVAEDILTSEWVSVDTETDDDEDIPPCEKTLYGVSLAWGNPEDPTGFYWNFEEDAHAWKTFRKRILGPLFERTDVKMPYWNLAFDIQVLRARGMEPKGELYDGMMLSYLIDENNRHALKACAKRDLGVKTAPTYKESKREIKAVGVTGQKIIKQMALSGWKAYRDHRKKAAEVEMAVSERWPLGRQAAFRLPPGMKKAEVMPQIDRFVRPKIEAVYAARQKEMFEKYATDDAVWTLQLTYMYLQQVRELGLERLFHALEVPVVDAIADIETRGVKMDVDVLRILQKVYGAKIADKRAEIIYEQGEEFNPASNDQMRQYLWGDCEIEPPKWAFSKKNRKAGNLDPVKFASVDKDILAWVIENHDIPLAEMVLKLRKLEKLKSTYIDGLLTRALAEKDHRIHCSFNPVGTVNDRWSSSNPNLQNQPRPGTTEGAVSMYTDDEGVEQKAPSIRRAYIPRDGYRFLNADFSQIELRYLAHVTKDPELLAAYQTWRCYTCGAEGKTDTALHLCPECWTDEVEAKGHETVQEGFVLGEDIHWITAVVTGLVEHYGPIEGRYRAKSVNFGLIYGMYPKLLAAMIDVPLEVAEDIHARFFMKYQKVRSFHLWVRRTLEERGWFTLLSGRKRHFTKERDLFHKGIIDDFGLGKTVREATNSIIQGGAAYLMKMVVRDLTRDFRSGKYGDTGIVLQVHDELLIEFPEAMEESVRNIVVDRMEHVTQLAVPIITEPEVKMAWAA